MKTKLLKFNGLMTIVVIAFLAVMFIGCSSDEDNHESGNENEWSDFISTENVFSGEITEMSSSLRKNYASIKIIESPEDFRTNVMPYPDVVFHVDSNFLSSQLYKEGDTISFKLIRYRFYTSFNSGPGIHHESGDVEYDTIIEIIN